MFKKALFLSVALAMAIYSYAQVDSLHMNKLGQRGYPFDLSDIWGWADTANGLEYALVGVQTGFSMVDVTVPQNPVEKFFIAGAFGLWKDLKAYGHYGYMGHDFQYNWSNLEDDGIMIVNLDSLDNPTYKKFRPQFTLPNGNIDSLRTSHNIYIDEKGVLYVFGANINNGGALMFDLSADPWNPTYLGMFDNYYLHDGYVRNDTLYGGAINDGIFVIVDVRQKSAPVLLASKETPNQFAHNVWLSDDGNTLFTTDEKPSAFVAAYDIADVNNITELDKIRTLPGTDIIPHNTHVLGDFLVTSYYTRGAHIIDAEYPDLMVEVGYYDTSPLFSGNGYHGAWGAYPYLPSGNVLISDMEEGLYILSSDYERAARVYGIVVDSLTGLPINSAQVDFTKRTYSKSTSFDGRFKYGDIEPGFETILASASGYYPNVFNYDFVNGQTDTIELKLLPLSFSVEESTKNAKLKIYPNPSTAKTVVELSPVLATGQSQIIILSANGAVVFQQEVEGKQKVEVFHQLPAGTYVLQVTNEALTESKKLIVY